MPTFLRRILLLPLRLLMVAAGLAFGALVLLAGLVLAVVLVLWSLVRGRRPQVVRMRMNARAPFGNGTRRAPPVDAEVVDVEAREVPDTPARLNRDAR